MTEVGKAAYSLLQKKPEKIGVVDMQREMQKSTLKEINEIIDTHKDYAPEYFIHVMYQKDRVIPNLIRQKFIVRRTRPSPYYDTSLFSFDNRTNDLKYHWTIPDQDTCEYMLINESSLSSDEKQLLSFVKQFCDGKLE